MNYIITHDIVTGVNGLHFVKDEIVNECKLIENTIVDLLKIGAVIEVSELKKGKKSEQQGIDNGDN